MDRAVLTAGRDGSPKTMDTHADPAAGSRGRMAVTGVIAVLVGLAVLWTAYAYSLYEAAGRPGATRVRLAQAERAVSLQPFNARFAWRVRTLEARALLERGRVDAAYRLLEPYAQVVRGDELFRQVYRHVVRVKTPLDSRKAHVQHAREQTGGILREEDVIK